MISGPVGPLLVAALAGSLAGCGGARKAAAVKGVLWEFDAIHTAVERAGGRLVLASAAGDIERARREKKLALVVGLDSGVGIEDLEVLRAYHRLGLRKLAVVHAGPVAWADSCFCVAGDSHRGHV